jgi:hypothetical protein
VPRALDGARYPGAPVVEERMRIDDCGRIMPPRSGAKPR